MLLIRLILNPRQEWISGLNPYTLKNKFLFEEQVFPTMRLMNKSFSYFLLGLAVVVLTGGIIAYAKAESLVSLSTSIVFAIAFFLSGLSVVRRPILGSILAFISSFALFGLFLYRYSITGAHMPPVLMMALSTPVLVISSLKLCQSATGSTESQ